jgi:hypothetical protein
MPNPRMRYITRHLISLGMCPKCAVEVDDHILAALVEHPDVRSCPGACDKALGKFLGDDVGAEHDRH